MIVLASVLHMTGRVFDRSYTVDSTGMICGLSDLYLYVNLDHHLFTYCLAFPLEYIVYTCIRMYIVQCTSLHCAERKFVHCGQHRYHNVVFNVYPTSICM
jgi:hypothetical protein